MAAKVAVALLLAAIAAHSAWAADPTPTPVPSNPAYEGTLSAGSTDPVGPTTSAVVVQPPTVSAGGTVQISATVVCPNSAIWDSTKSSPLVTINGQPFAQLTYKKTFNGGATAQIDLFSTTPVNASLFAVPPNWAFLRTPGTYTISAKMPDQQFNYLFSCQAAPPATLTVQ